MISFINEIEDFRKQSNKLGFTYDLDAVRELDFPFFDHRDKFTIISVPLYGEGLRRSIILLSKKKSLVLTDFDFRNGLNKAREILTKPYGESTLLALNFFRGVLKNYSREFERLRARMNELDLNPILEKIERSGRDLRRLTDRFEELVQLIIVLKEREIKEVNTELIGFDYELINAEARYWLERCRSHIYRISSLRTKSEMKSNRELNSTMHRLTLIMTFLTITSIVVSVPGTIGAIFGIPALSDAFFKPHTTLLVWILISSTLLSILLGFVYWKSLGFRN